MSKYADDGYLLIPESLSSSADSEVLNVVEWAGRNNLVLNTAKCKELIVYRTKRPPTVPPPALKGGIERVLELKMHGVFLQPDLSMDVHIRYVATRATQILYALRVFRAHGWQGRPLHIV